MSVQYSGDAATTRTSLGLGDAATKTTGTAAGNIPVLDGSGQIASGVLSNAAVADNAITLAKMAGGTDGNLITYDASGDPAYVTTGTSGQVLTSGGVGVAPTFQTAASGGGKVLQVITGEVTTSTSVATSTFTDVGLSASITPSSTSSKILCMWTMQGSFGSYNSSIGVQLVRGSTNVYSTSGLSDVRQGGGGWDYSLARSYYYLDSPSTTSATTYKVQVGSKDSKSVSVNSTSKQTLVLMEIGA